MRPVCSSWYSSQSSISVTVWVRKKSGVARWEVMSQAVALAPFSQNSKGSGLAGLTQAQLTHWKPSTLFCRVSARAPLAGTPVRRRILPRERAEPQPPAGLSYGLNDGSLFMW